MERIGRRTADCNGLAANDGEGIPNGDRREGGIDLAIVQKDERGHEFSPLKESLHLSLPLQGDERVLREGFRLSRHVTLHPDATVVRIVVRDQSSGNVGSLTIPAKGL